MSIDKNHFIDSVKKSNYTFKRFYKNDLKNGISVLQLMNYNTISWDKIIEEFYNLYNNSTLFRDRKIYCFLSSLYWSDNNRISQHYGLEKLLKKEFNVQSIEFEFENKIINKSKILFYGIIQLTQDNSKEIFELLSETESGILFSWHDTSDNDFSGLIDELVEIIEKKDDDTTLHFNVVKAINAIVEKKEIVLYPHKWNETKEYYLDIFFRRVQWSDNDSSTKR